MLPQPSVFKSIEQACGGVNDVVMRRGEKIDHVCLLGLISSGRALRQVLPGGGIQ